MPKLLIKPQPPGADGQIHAVTPASAGWRYVGFAVHRLDSGQTLARAGDDRELCLVMLSGTARVGAGGRDFGRIGGRASPFEPEVWSFYVPAGMDWTVAAESACEIALCSAPGKPGLPARVISPQQVERLTRGAGSNVRHVRNILPETEPAESLLVVEVVTPGGNWSSYPSHKHARDALPEESELEETYYHRFSPPQGFGFQRVYTDDRSLDEAMAIEDRDVVLVPRGYHPVAAPHGYDLYYLNVMAGPRRVWRFRNEPAHEWLVEAAAPQ
jgi:5-deoxy-glucuronate isomerase